MTFAVVTVAENRERVVGTIWAAAEAEAEAMATSLFVKDDHRDPQVILRRAEEREIPLRVLMN